MARKQNLNLTMVKIVIMWARGLPIDTIANSLFVPKNTANSYLRRARMILGVDFVPLAPPRRGRMLKRPPSVLDQLVEPGQQIRVTKEEAGSRANIHQNAETRGWAVSVNEVEDGWLITASHRVPPRAHRLPQCKR